MSLVVLSERYVPLLTYINFRRSVLGYLDTRCLQSPHFVSHSKVTDLNLSRIAIENVVGLYYNYDIITFQIPMVNVLTVYVS